MSNLEILIVEDNVAEQQAAQAALGAYHNVYASFASTIVGAHGNLPKVAIVDVVFPFQHGDAPDAFNALLLEAYYLSQDPPVPFIYNTSRTHRDAEVMPLRQFSKCVGEDYGFGIGQVIESPSAASPGSRNPPQPKSWKDVIDYAIVVARARDMAPGTRAILQNEFFAFPPWGDYGHLPKVLAALLDTRISLDHLYEGRPAPWEHIPNPPGRRWSLKAWGPDGVSVLPPLDKKSFEDAIAWVRGTVGAYRTLP